MQFYADSSSLKIVTFLSTTVSPQTEVLETIDKYS